PKGAQSALMRQALGVHSALAKPRSFIPPAWMPCPRGPNSLRIVCCGPKLLCACGAPPPNEGLWKEMSNGRLALSPQLSQLRFAAVELVSITTPDSLNRVRRRPESAIGI